MTEAERDEYLRLFSHRPEKPGEATQWLRQWMRDTKMKQPDIEELPGFEELFKKTIEALSFAAAGAPSISNRRCTT